MDNAVVFGSWLEVPESQHSFPSFLLCKGKRKCKSRASTKCISHLREENFNARKMNCNITQLHSEFPPASLTKEKSAERAY